MKKSGKLICLSLSLLTMMPLSAGAANDKEEENESSALYDWTPVMDAIITVESGGNVRAVNGNQVGAMQITPICVKECNLILQARGSNKRYTLNDRYDLEKSKEMFLLIQSHRNKTNDVEKAIRAWNGGPQYSTRATERYYQKVRQRMNKYLACK